MKLLPNTHCPACGGTITFFDVMSIVTPFQSISCATCGEMVFLRHRWGLMFIALGVSLFSVLVAFLIMANEWMPGFAVFILVFLIPVVAEFIITAHVVKKKGLVVRRNP
ncbi:MAG: hypothetical protein IPP35_04685 [Elusimicrobia bacterium]|nr:hypothetical protein [Elusimicrobiota bacterium]